MATAPQRQQLTPERVEDADHGGHAESDMGIDLDLSADEMAQLDAMRTGERDGGADASGADDGGGDGDADADGDAGADGMDADADAARAGERDPGAGDDRGAKDDQSGQRPPPKTINYARHQREISRREQRVAELTTALETERAARQKDQERVTRLDERTQLLLNAINAKPKPEAEKEPEDPEPNPDEDPIAHALWTRRELGRTQQRLANFEQRTQQTEQQRTAASAEEALLSDFSGQIEMAARSDPNFADAFVHLRETRYRELGFIYADIDINDPQQCATLSQEDQAKLSNAIQRAFANEQLMVAQEARQTRRPIAKTIMNLAKSRGFDPTAAAARRAAAAGNGADADGDDTQRQRGQQRPAPRGQQQRGAPQRNVSQELEAIREGAAASKSLSDAGGSPGGQIDLKRLADMPAEEFEELLASMPKHKLDALMGKGPPT